MMLNHLTNLVMSPNMNDERWFTATYFEPVSGPAKYLSLLSTDRSNAILKFQNEYPGYMLVSLHEGIGMRPASKRVRT